MNTDHQSILAAESFGNLLAITGSVRSGGGDCFARTAMSPKCKIHNCLSNVKRIGLCSAHYKRLRKFGDPLGGKPIIARNTDLTGMRFNKFTVLCRYTGQHNPKWKNKHRSWIVQCDCGKQVIRYTGALKGGEAKHCGCSYPKKSSHFSWTGCGDLSGTNFHHIEKWAKKSGKQFNLTCEWLWELYQKQNGLCALSGVPICFARHREAHKFGWTACSLDRIDSTKGYIMGNVQWVCLMLNYMKRNIAQDRFIEVCHLVSKRHSKGESSES